MAFASALRSGSRDAGTVRLTADTGEFNAKVEQAERQWRESVGSMSREALKLDLAQDRLKRSLANYGAESNQAKRATIALKDAEETSARAADRSAREHNQLAAAHERQRRSIGGLTRGVVGLAAGLGGAYGLISLLRSSLDLAKEEQNVRGQTRVALESLGLAYDRYADRIDHVINRTSALGFDDEELLRSFQLLVRGSGNVETGLDRTALAAGVARGRYISLEQATQIVNKAQLGMSGGLRRLGLDVEKNATSTELLAALTKAYGRAAVDASDDAVAAGDRLEVQWENMREVAARGLLPTVTRLSDRMAVWFGDSRNQAEVQRRVNAAVETGEEVVRGFAGGLRIVRSALSPVVELMGGAENAARALFLVLAVSRLARIATAVRGIGSAFGFAAAQATLFGGAAAGANAAAAAGGAAGARRVTPVGVTPVTTLAVLGLIAYSAASGSPQQLAGGYGEPIGRTPDGRPVYRKGGRLYVAGRGPGAGRFVTSVRVGGGGIPVSLYEYEPPREIVAPGEGRPAPGSTRPSRATGGGAAGDGLTALQRIELRQQEAALTDSPSDDLRAGQDRVRYWQRVLRNTKKTGDELFQIRSSLNAALSQVQSIEDKIANDQKQAAEERARKRKEAEEKAAAAERHRRRVERARLERRYRDDLIEAGASIRNPNLVRGPRGGRRTATATTGSGAGAGASMQELLESLTGIFSQFEPSVFTRGPSGKLTPGSSRIPQRSVHIEQHFHADRSQSSAIREARLAAMHNL